MSGEFQSVVIMTPDPVAPAGHDEAMIALVDKAATDKAAADRPDWLPAKFASAQEMAASYAELETKLGGVRAAPVAPAVAPAAASATAAPASAPSDALTIPADPVAAEAAAVKAGLDVAALNAEYQTSGSLSEASLAKLATAGFDKATVDAYIEGRIAVAAAFTQDVLSTTPGGADKYTEMVSWAKANLSQPEIDAYNASVSTNDRERAKLAVAGLGAKFTASVGNEPLLTGGRIGSGSADVYATTKEMRTDMSSPKYKSDPAFRKAVSEKLGRSSIF